MKQLLLAGVCGLSLLAQAAAAQQPTVQQPGVQQPGAPQTGPYSVLSVERAGGDGGFDYVYADAPRRRLYIPRSGLGARVSVFDLDSLQPAGELAGVSAHGVAVDDRSGHGFASSKPVAMWDAKTLSPLKSIEVQGNPDGILADPYSRRVYVFSHGAPNVTAIDAATGAIFGLLDLGGAPEQAATDEAGHLFVDLVDKDEIAVVDTKTLTVIRRISLAGTCGAPAGLAMDAKTHVLFAACRRPAVMAVLSADSGKVLAVLPIGAGVDGVAFNPRTSEAISSQADGTLTVVKALSPTSFAVEQTVQTKSGAKTLALDKQTGRIVTMTAEFGPTPAPTPGEPGAANARPRRGPMIPGTFEIIAIGSAIGR